MLEGPIIARIHIKKLKNSMLPSFRFTEHDKYIFGRYYHSREISILSKMGITYIDVGEIDMIYNYLPVTIVTEAIKMHGFKFLPKKEDVVISDMDIDSAIFHTIYKRQRESFIIGVGYKYLYAVNSSEVDELIGNCENVMLPLVKSRTNINYEEWSKLVDLLTRKFENNLFYSKISKPVSDRCQQLEQLFEQVQVLNASPTEG